MVWLWQPSQDAPAVHHDALFGVMAAPLRFQTNSARLFSLAIEAFARFGPPTRDEPFFQMRLFTQSAPVSPSHDVWPLVVRADGDYYYVTWGPTSALAADLKRGYMFGYLSPDVLAWSYGVIQAFLLAPVLYGLLWHGYLELRCAVLLWRRRYPVYLVREPDVDIGPLLYHAVRCGWRLVSVENVRAVRTPRGYHFWGVPWWLALPLDAGAHFPELDPARSVLGPDGTCRLVVDVEDVWPGSTEPHAGPGPLVWVRPERGSPRYEPVEADTFLQEAPLVDPHKPRWVQEGSIEVATFLAQHGTYLFTLTDNWPEGLRVLEGLLAQHVRE